MTETGETLGQRLRDLRLRNGLSQEQLAERAGVLIGTIRNWEQGQRSPDALDTLYRLARALGVPMERLVEGIEGTPPRGVRKKTKGRRRRA
jgi:transcriptional regulator with XRE-family HTH domain